jgi:hypothetical protein
MKGDIYEALAEYRNGNGKVYAQDQFGLWHQVADEQTKPQKKNVKKPSTVGILLDPGPAGGFGAK